MTSAALLPRLLAATLCATLPALAACGGGSASQAGVPADSGARKVRVVAAARGTLPEVVSVSGTLAAEEQAALGMKVAGRLGEIRVDLGSRVAKGDVLARLVPTDFELRVQQAEAALAQARVRLGLPPAPPADGEERVELESTAVVRQARATLNDARARRDRAAALFREKLLPQADLDTAQANFEVAESRYQDAIEEARNRQAVLAERRSELELARQQLADSTLTAPFAGAVRERQATSGQYVDAGQAIVTLVRVHPLRLRLAVPERAAARLQLGQEVRLRIEGDPRRYAGRVARISPAIEETNRTLMIEAEVPNPDGALRPGSFAAAEIVTAADRPVVLVPASAIVSFAGLEKVIVVADGKAVEKRVRTGRRVAEQVEIVEGLEDGALVVVDPGNLVGGQPVAIVG